MIVTETRAAHATSDCKAALAILRLRRVEVLLEVRDHTVTGVAVGTEESVVVTDTIQALPHLLLAEVLALVLHGEGFDCALLAFDIFLDVSLCPSFRVDLLSGNGDEILSEEV